MRRDTAMVSLMIRATRRQVITDTRPHTAVFISAAAGAADITATTVMAVTGMATGTAADMAVTAVNGPVAAMAVAEAMAVVDIDKYGPARAAFSH